MNKFPWVVMLLFASTVAHAQQSPCGGMVDVGGGHCVPPNVVYGEGGQQSAPAYQGPLWQDRYGAIAVDDKTGSIGWASGARNKKEAYKAAIADCGGGGCKVSAWVRNDCLATAWGKGGVGYGNDPDTHQAEALALKSCKDVGGNACVVQYSACSLPVRIR